VVQANLLAPSQALRRATLRVLCCLGKPPPAAAVPDLSVRRGVHDVLALLLDLESQACTLENGRKVVGLPVPSVCPSACPTACLPACPSIRPSVRQSGRAHAEPSAVLWGSRMHLSGAPAGGCDDRPPGQLARVRPGRGGAPGPPDGGAPGHSAH
jgi:hypothetical protein